MYGILLNNLGPESLFSDSSIEAVAKPNKDRPTRRLAETSGCAQFVT